MRSGIALGCLGAQRDCKPYRDLAKATVRSRVLPIGNHSGAQKRRCVRVPQSESTTSARQARSLHEPAVCEPLQRVRVRQPARPFVRLFMRTDLARQFCPRCRSGRVRCQPDQPAAVAIHARREELGES